MTADSNAKPTENGHYVFYRYIVRNGVKVYPRKRRVFRFWVKD